MTYTYEEMLALSTSEVTVTEKNGLVYRYTCAPFNFHLILDGEETAPDMEPDIKATADICLRHPEGSKVSYVGKGMRVYGPKYWHVTHWEAVQIILNELKESGYTPAPIPE